MLMMLISLIAAFGLLFATWLHYLAIMNLSRVRNANELPIWARRFGMIALGIGYLLDFISNILVLTALMFELPHELLVSARVSRHLRNGTGNHLWTRWRYNVALWTCKNLLDPFDPSGCHCK